MSAPRIAAASSVGTLLEYYDFALYNSLAGLVFNALFFPAGDPWSGILLSFSGFAVGYAARPIGGMVFGRLGDTHGRRYVLTATLWIMGAATVLIGLLPGYARAGVLAPVALIALRFAQGAALGGEWAGAVLLSLEHGPQHSRGQHGAWAQIGPSLGTLLATGLLAAIGALLSPSQFQAWGWRVPFVLSLAVAAYGLWVRLGVPETPVFAALQLQPQRPRAPLRQVLTGHWRSLLLAGGARLGPDVQYSLLAAFTLTYLTTVLQQTRTLALLAVSIGGAAHAAAIPWCARLSDHFGRRPVYVLGVLAALLWSCAYFGLLDTRRPPLIVLAVSAGFLVHALMYGPQAAFIVEQFPARVRYAGASLAYTWIGIVGGGIAPLLFAALWRCFQSSLALALYVALALAVSAAALLAARETAGRPLEN